MRITGQPIIDFGANAADEKKSNQAEAVRLKEEIKKNAYKPLWPAVEADYQKYITLIDRANITPDAATFYFGGLSAEKQKDANQTEVNNALEAYHRYWSCYSINPTYQESTDKDENGNLLTTEVTPTISAILNDYSTHFSSVQITIPAKSTFSLTVSFLPMDPKQSNSIHYVQNVLSEQSDRPRTLDLLLPVGVTYTITNNATQASTTITPSDLQSIKTTENISDTNPSYRYPLTSFYNVDLTPQKATTAKPEKPPLPPLKPGVNIFAGVGGGYSSLTDSYENKFNGFQGSVAVGADYRALLGKFSLIPDFSLAATQTTTPLQTSLLASAAVLVGGHNEHTEIVAGPMVRGAFTFLENPVEVKLPNGDSFNATSTINTPQLGGELLVHTGKSGITADVAWSQLGWNDPTKGTIPANEITVALGYRYYF